MNKEQLIIKIKRMFMRKGTVSNEIIVFDSSLDSENQGDSIIMHYCNKILDELWENNNKKRITFHSSPTEPETEDLIKYKYKILCGTNVLSPRVEHFCAFKTSRRLDQYNDICLLGVGWGMYSEVTSKTSCDFYRCILSKRWIHSVRDCYTEAKLREMGFKNVVYTACPTMWNLTPELCRKIPKKRSNKVVFTITDYDQDKTFDNEMISIILNNYEEIYFWAQGKGDLEYLQKLKLFKDIIIISDLNEYTKLLEKGDIDFVGTRLHAGIHALNHGIRTIVVAIDNRAIEIGKNTKLPIVLRDMIVDLDNLINSEWETKIELPYENIQKWKEQF